uniref:Hepcidin n=1 Tax=Amphiprion ocellaris TaxID=80972 RepID=A0A3Q1CA31_AMPOC
MKTFSVTAALAEQALEEPLRPEHPAAAHEERIVDSWKMLYNSRNKRGIYCRFCCCCCCTPCLCKFCCRF